MQKIVSIQYLRALAALFVFYYHANGISLYGNMSWLLEQGHYGVDIFFMISGFVMAHVMVNSPTHEEFFKKRIMRIYPLYFLILIICFATNGFSVWGGKFFDLTLFNFFDDKPARHYHLPVAWTLYYEMFFYLICTFAIWLFKDHKKGIFLFFVLTIFAQKFLNVFSGLDSRLFFIFLSGFYFYQLTRSRDYFYNALCLLICLIEIRFLFIDGALKLWIIIGAMIFIRFFDTFKIKELKSLSLIGDASYSIYLLHMSLCFLINKALPSDMIARQFLFSFYSIILIAICIANYWYVERNLVKILGFCKRKFFQLLSQAAARFICKLECK